MDNEPAAATFRFDPDGSFGEVYLQQGSDHGFATGLLGMSVFDERFPRMREVAKEEGLDLRFIVEELPGASHPNTVWIEMVSRSGQQVRAVASSTGGGTFAFTELNGWPVHLTGDAHELLVLASGSAIGEAEDLLTHSSHLLGQPAVCRRGDQALLHARRTVGVGHDLRLRLESLSGVDRVWTIPALLFVVQGNPLFQSAASMVARAEHGHRSLGQTALAYESRLLGLGEEEVLSEIVRRLEIMEASVERGLSSPLPETRLVEPTARSILAADSTGSLPFGGIHTRAAARAMAAMHVSGAMGIVCAAPTAGSAGVLPGVMVSLVQEWGLPREAAALALLAASAVGLVVATRATFAAEVAGCQVEIGASGAMAAAAVVEAAGGGAQEAVHAAAIALQNTMGMICDPVQGMVEIPCHTRNAVAASSAFVCADLVLGGYVNPIPLDETVDAVYAVGKMLPRELKCTALGGLSITPSALALPRRDNR
jgi:L-serine dehydratase